MQNEELVVILTERNKKLKEEIKRLENLNEKLSFKLIYWKKIYQIFEDIFTIVAGLFVMLAIVGIFYEHFQYNYDGWFDKYALLLLIIGIVILIIPNFVKGLGNIKWKRKKKKK